MARVFGPLSEPRAVRGASADTPPRPGPGHRPRQETRPPLLHPPTGGPSWLLHAAHPGVLLYLTRPSGHPIDPAPPHNPTPAMNLKRSQIKTNKVRPRKAAGPKRRRQLEQRRRLVALGVPEEQVEKMNPREVRDMLKYPAKVEKQYASK